MGLIRAIFCAICVCVAGGAVAQAPVASTDPGQMALLPQPALLQPARDVPIPEDLPEAIAEALPPDLSVDLPLEDISPLAPAASLRPAQREAWAMPALLWDDHPRGAGWSLAVMSALRGPGAPLLDVVPRDIEAWCPAYPQAGPAQRAAFWAGLISTLAYQESTHRPRAVGGGGRWFGLVQIYPPTARFRSCAARSGEALLNGAANLRCGIRIMAITVPRDGVVAEGNRGVAADWGPMHSSQRRKREEMRNWVRSQEYCTLPTGPVRPVPRPATSLANVAEGDLAGLRPMRRPDLAP